MVFDETMKRNIQFFMRVIISMICIFTMYNCIKYTLKNSIPVIEEKVKKQYEQIINETLSSVIDGEMSYYIK